MFLQSQRQVKCLVQGCPGNLWHSWNLNKSSCSKSSPLTTGLSAVLATTAVGIGSVIVGICRQKKGGNKKKKKKQGGGKQKKNIGVFFSFFLSFFFLTQREIHSSHNNTCWVVKMQPRLMLSGTVVIYGVRARIQCWHKVLLFPVLAEFALVNMPFKSAWQLRIIKWQVCVYKHGQEPRLGAKLQFRGVHGFSGLS